jgi:2-octaprenyl-6-methoxyphenol hydroxylase
MGKTPGNTDILIIGAGLAGLSLAAILGRAGVKVHLVEPFPPPALKETKVSGRTVALMDSSLNIIKATGVWDKVSSFANPLKTMRIIDDSRAGQDNIEIEFPASDIGLEQFGFNVPNGMLRSALFEKVQKIPAITLHKSALAAYEVEGAFVKAKLDDGTKIQCRLIIGADGRNSRVREIAGIAIKDHDYNQKAITCVINHSRAHENMSTEFHRSSGPFALVPLPGNQSSVVWVEQADKADEIMKLKKQDFAQALQNKTQDILGGITLETNPECWPLRSIKATEFTAPRMVLIAEAAHVMSPITAQGLNLSLRDAASLAETIVDALRVGIDPGSETILKKYARRRRVDINTRVFGVDGMNRIVSTEANLIKGIRRVGLKTFGAVDPLRKIAMQTGLAPQLDLGRLAKGEAL